ncbi:uncharacterized protein A1O9_01457 [Exophiala aquamarina CBS 119918]|uniref:Tr-type G domain-containing protein n=1 Tax=Exophiala aquamarina CBS 119918 TaxID=1182545 RepID=A0A072PTP7_9EURO|nr:uncharacterized protein A1O9_01457 [Exophiala aquamarina CBS 119918]KEF63479.1 hypothetical protein A1O9_01457 [Exophiala aquamarina CBS 119918]
MASIFTYQDEPPRIHSPWSTPGTSTPQPLQFIQAPVGGNARALPGIFKLEAEQHDGPTEYKLHLLLRPRRNFRSISGATPLSTSLQPTASQTAGSLQSMSASPLDRSATQPSTQVRQNRLHQLTTQLLWRLQQSSPFHSSSNADLVLPLLPEATPKLGVPDRPAKLLPGLEESQGALYEIGIADDGTLVGLLEDELQESLHNLQAMAASLGCVTKVLRKVAVGSCEWVDTEEGNSQEQRRQDKLWVAEVLVHPDSRKPEILDATPIVPAFNKASSSLDHSLASMPRKAPTEQIRVTLLGATASGKSSLLGTLSTSVRDNGRGKSRLSLLKHRHEIASGITSSVAQELIGYAEDISGSNLVINYASGDVSSWIDIHNLSQRLVFVSDSPGLPRFAKSTFRALVSWNPAWTVLCVAANDHDQQSGLVDPSAATTTVVSDHSKVNDTPNTIDISASHLDLCLRMQIPLVIAITKMDLANKAGLRMVLARILSALKAAGRKPVILSSTVGPITVCEGADLLRDLQIVKATDVAEINSLMRSTSSADSLRCVPIVMTSTITGSGISKIHALFRCLKSPEALAVHDLPSMQRAPESALFHVDEVFSIPPSRVYSTDQDDILHRQGIVLCGHVAAGTVTVGSILKLGPLPMNSDPTSSSTSARSQTLQPFSCSTSETMQSERLASVASMAYSPTGNAKSASHLHDTSGPLLSVRIVSLRNLRLPVGQLQRGETGTVGVELVTLEHTDLNLLERARKGMVLIDSSRSGYFQERQDLTGYRSFSAVFPSSDFAQRNSPPLILGGHALVYVNSIRGAVKVTAVALDDEKEGRENDDAEVQSETEVFRFDSDDEADVHAMTKKGKERDVWTLEKSIKITFRFMSTVEWMEIGDRVLVVPTVTAPGPVTGPVAPNLSPLAGFVGRICNCFA